MYYTILPWKIALAVFLILPANFDNPEKIVNKVLKLDTNFENRVINEDLFKTIHQTHALHALASINRKYIFKGTNDAKKREILQIVIDDKI